MESKEKNSAVLLDLGGVLFENNPNISKSTKLIQNCIRGNDIEQTAKDFGIERVLDEIKITPEFLAISDEKKNKYLGGCLLNYIRNSKIVSDQDFLNARIDMVRLRDERILNAIRETYPNINIAIATADAPIGHQVISYYLPEIAPYLQVITSDSDIDSSKTCRLFYDNTNYRLSSNGIYVPTDNMVLVDDDKKNLGGIIDAGGTGVLYNSNDNKDLKETILDGIEGNLRR